MDDYNIEYMKRVNPIYTMNEMLEFIESEVSEEKLSWIESTLDKKPCSIMIYDGYGKFLSCLYSPINKIENKALYPKHILKNIHGNNAVSLALENNKPMIVKDEEHTLKQLSHHTGYAYPLIYNDQSKACLYVLLESEDFDEEFMALINLLATVLTSSELVYKVLYHAESLHRILQATTDKIYSGVIFIDDNKFIHGFNQAILSSFDIKKGEDVRRRLLESLDTLSLDLTKTYHNQMIKYKGKPMILSSKPMYLCERYIGTLLTFVDQEEINELHQTFKNVSLTFDFNSIVHRSEKMKALLALAHRISSTNCHVLIQGESGTGKELLAQSIHQDSNRSNFPFVAINCGAIPKDLIESELFGYESGAFTGASKGGKKGKLEFASGGTLFLDEIESMPLATQVKLLRVMSSKTVSRIGSLYEKPVDLRIIAATKKDLLELSNEGSFREDLYYRLQVMELHIPALRERKEDIPIIVDSMIKQDFNDLVEAPLTVNQNYYEALKCYDWPGNVRELRNIVERSLLLKDGNELTIHSLDPKIVECAITKKVLSEGEEGKLYEAFERQFLQHVLEGENGNLVAASKKLGISRQTLYRKLKW